MCDEIKQIPPYYFNLATFMEKNKELKNFDGFMGYLLATVAEKSQIMLKDQIKNRESLQIEVFRNIRNKPSPPKNKFAPLLETVANTDKQGVDECIMFTLEIINGKEINSDQKLFDRITDEVNKENLTIAQFRIN